MLHSAPRAMKQVKARTFSEFSGILADLTSGNEASRASGGKLIGVYWGLGFRVEGGMRLSSLSVGTCNVQLAPETLGLADPKGP